jgi:dihydrodipicolinate synthase/N-acetylneuraminate lyase
MIAPAQAVKLHRMLYCERNLAAARELWYRLLPIIHVEYRSMGTDAADPHWLAVCREAADLRGLSIGVSRPPLSRVSAEVRQELKHLLTGLGEL